MRKLLAAVALLAISVFGAHALAFVVMKGLPEPAVAALGIQSAQPAARAAFEEEKATRGYLRILSDLSHGDLGTTLDGVPVTTELTAALTESLPRLTLACGLVGLAIVGVAFSPRRMLAGFAYLGTLLAFMPPFVAPFVGFGAVLAIGGVSADWLRSTWLVASICLAVPAAALASAQTAAVTSRNLGLPFAVTLRAVGASQTRQRTRLLRNLILELAPSFEKLGAGLFAALLFVEPIFGLGGLGALMLRAIRRTDVDTILALVLTLALVINLLRILATMIRGRHGVIQP